MNIYLQWLVSSVHVNVYKQLSINTLLPSQAINHDVDKFCEEVEECIQRQHYEATHLAMLARSLQESMGRVSRAVVDRVRVAKGGVSFYKGVERVRVRGREGGREGGRVGEWVGEEGGRERKVHVGRREGRKGQMRFDICSICLCFV